jgi:hypothetical protein
MGGMENDPDFATAAAPIVQHVNNEVAGWNIKTQHDAMGEQMSANTGAQLGMASQGGPAFNYGNTFSQYKNYFGGDGTRARTALDRDITSYAVANHDASALNSIAPAPGQTALPPQTQLEISEARQRISVDQTQDNKTASSKAQLTIMSSILNGKDPRALLQQYASIPGADPSFIPKAMGFSHSLGEQTAQDAITGNAGVGITAGIAEGKINNASDLVTAVQSTGATGKAASALLARGMSSLSQVQSLDAANPTYKAGIAYLAQKYKPATPIGGSAVGPNTAGMEQYAGAALDYRTEVASSLKNGKSPEEASTMALQSVEKKWGEPYGATLTPKSIPRTDADQSAAISQSTGDPQAFLSSGVNPNDIARLRDIGMVTPAQAAAAARIWLSHHTPAR